MKQTVHLSNPTDIVPSFTAHNVLLPNGTKTIPQKEQTIDQHPWFLGAKRTLELVFPGEKSGYSLVDLGALEGGYTVEFAKMGFQALGIEVRSSNIAACNYLKEQFQLPNLQFVKDDVRNVQKYGQFDVTFCCGLLYHLDNPREFLHQLGKVTRKVLILQTHFATFQKNEKFCLSDLTVHEGLLGRWYLEYANEQEFSNQEEHRWRSWNNHYSFWILKEYLLGELKAIGFDIVYEQYDALRGDITESLMHGYYETDSRSMFIAIRS